MWQEKNRLALDALVAGDEEKAVTIWKECVKSAEKSDAAPCAELAQAYHGLGKILLERKSAEAAKYLERAVELLSMPGSDAKRLAAAKSDFAKVAGSSSKEEPPVSLFKEALDLQDKYEWIPLKQALSTIHKNKVGMDLKREELTNLCTKLNVDPEGNNNRLDSLLLMYYTDPVKGTIRAEQDGFVSAHLTEFDIKSVVLNLARAVKHKAKVKLDKCDGNLKTKDFMNVTLGYNEEKQQVGEVTSVDDLVSMFNDIMDEMNHAHHFNELYLEGRNDNVTAYYFLPDDVHEKISETNALRFWSR